MFEAIPSKSKEVRAYQAACADRTLITLQMSRSTRVIPPYIECEIKFLEQATQQIKIFLQPLDPALRNTLSNVCSINTLNHILGNLSRAENTLDRALGLELQKIIQDFFRPDASKISDLIDPNVYINTKTFVPEKDETIEKNTTFPLDPLTPELEIKYANLIAAACAGDTKKLKSILAPAGKPPLVLDKGMNDNIIFHCVSNFSRSSTSSKLDQVIGILIKHGAEYRTFFLTRNANIEIIKLFISCGANVNVDYKGYTALHNATLQSDRELIDFLLKNGANVNVAEQIDGFGTPLHICIANEHFEEAIYLIERAKAYHCPCDYTVKDREGKTALVIAVKTMSLAVVNKIIEADKTCIDMPDLQGRTPLHFACALGQREIVKALLNAGADVNAKDKQGNTPAHYATSGLALIKTILFSIYIDPDRDSGALLNAIIDSSGPILIRKSLAEDCYIGLKTTQLTRKSTNTKIFIEILCCIENKTILNNMLNKLPPYDKELIENQIKRMTGQSIAQACLAGQPKVLSLLVIAGANITTLNNNGKIPQCVPVSWVFKYLTAPMPSALVTNASGEREPTGAIKFYDTSLKIKMLL